MAVKNSTDQAFTGQSQLVFFELWPANSYTITRLSLYAYYSVGPYPLNLMLLCDAFADWNSPHFQIWCLLNREKNQYLIFLSSDQMKLKNFVWLAT